MKIQHGEWRLGQAIMGTNKTISTTRLSQEEEGNKMAKLRNSNAIVSSSHLEMG
jgi:hypothetical protein